MFVCLFVCSSVAETRAAAVSSYVKRFINLFWRRGLTRGANKRATFVQYCFSFAKMPLRDCPRCCLAPALRITRVNYRRLSLFDH